MHWGMQLKKFIPFRHASDHDSENSPNRPPVNFLTSSNSSSICFSSPNINPSFYFVFSSIITTLEPYMPTKSKSAHQSSTLPSHSSITQTVCSASHSRRFTTTFFYPTSLVLADGTISSISLLILPIL